MDGRWRIFSMNTSLKNCVNPIFFVEERECPEEKCTFIIVNMQFLDYDEQLRLKFILMVSISLHFFCPNRKKM